MKIMHLMHYPGMGGAEQYALSLSQEAIGSGHDVYFILGQDGPLIKKLEKANIEYKIIKIPSFYNLKSIFLLRKEILNREIDIVHAHFLREHFLAVLAGIFGSRARVLRTVHREDRFYAKIKPLMSLFQRKTDAFIASSQYLKKRMTEEGIEEAKIHLIHNGVREVKAEEHQLALGYLGRLSEEKGILTFVKANLNKMNENLVIGGMGPDWDQVNKLAKGKDNITLLGHVTDKESFYSKISVLILPSRTEVAPLVLFEAFSAGVPVVAFDIAPLREFITQGNGIRVPGGNYERLYTEAEKLLRSKALSGYTNSVKKEWQEKYDVKLMWQKTEALYKSLLS